MTAPRFPSASGRALAALLRDEDSEEAKAIRAAIDRTRLWRFVTLRRRPDPDAIAQLHRLSNGKVDAAGWGVDVRRRSVARTGTEG